MAVEEEEPHECSMDPREGDHLDRSERWALGYRKDQPFFRTVTSP